MKAILLPVILLASSIFAFAQTTPEPTIDSPPGWWQIPKTKTILKLGGYVKFDLIHDFNPIASPDYFDVSKIPTDGSEGVSTHLHAKETRLYLDTKTATGIGEVRTYVEGDFYGTSGAFRLRHAFVEINDKWLAGQWWSNFMDESIIPATLDFEKPAAYVFARHAMFRYKHKLSGDAYFAIALEEPSKNGQTPAEPGAFESPLPDLTARYRITKDWGHFQASGFAAKIQYRYLSGGTDAVTLFGLNLSGRLNFLESDYLIYQAVYGPGSGRMRGGLSVALDSNGELQALDDLGFTVGVQHSWAPKVTSLLTYNHGIVDNTAGQSANNLHISNYLAANVLWHFTDRAFAGVEYLHGTRTDKNDASGAANRLQMSIKYTFN
ncbi:DcaP family trimeric outer membrane transporter [Algoriphagus jejuensis]|uniref:DcaP family trimeric outer membrane transporter n=1 Tax=Algoriphagus jejuensis TaxID=419934 RepID=A0ABN1N123_9BACT